MILGLPAAAKRVGNQSRPEEDTVLNRARLYVSRPADNGGYAEAAFENGAASCARRVIPPSGQVKNFSAVVGGENDDDGVVGFADVFEMR